MSAQNDTILDRKGTFGSFFWKAIFCHPSTIFSITVFDKNGKGINMITCDYFAITISCFMTIVLSMKKMDLFYFRLTGVICLEIIFVLKIKIII